MPGGQVQQGLHGTAWGMGDRKNGGPGAVCTPRSAGISLLRLPPVAEGRFLGSATMSPGGQWLCLVCPRLCRQPTPTGGAGEDAKAGQTLV